MLELCESVLRLWSRMLLSFTYIMFSTFFIHSSAFVRPLFIYISLRRLLLHFIWHRYISICVVSLKTPTPYNQIMVVDERTLYFFC